MRPTKWFSTLRGAVFSTGFLFVLCSSASAVIIEWATVGNPGNAPDPSVPGVGIGSVDYTYRISKYEVTNAQYAEFLNAVGAMDVVDLWNPSMEVLRFGTPGNYTYGTLPADALRPVRYVSIFDAMRFSNWLHNGQPMGNPGIGTTETGAYDMTVGFIPTRSPNATHFVPNGNEWHKAAYHDPRSALNFGPPLDDNYWSYPTRSDFPPIAEAPSSGSNSANLSSVVGDTVPVGSYPNTMSYYGTFDQAGNVAEWHENGIDLAGGRWSSSPSSAIAGTGSLTLDPSTENDIFGFRVASIPEPSPLLYGMLLIVGIALRRYSRLLRR